MISSDEGGREEVGKRIVSCWEERGLLECLQASKEELGWQGIHVCCSPGSRKRTGEREKGGGVEERGRVCGNGKTDETHRG
jgi:hypothetical protein